ncbi:MAG: fibronectin type III domain-containing protein, partial [Pseudomonadota bacterium]
MNIIQVKTRFLMILFISLGLTSAVYALPPDSPALTLERKGLHISLNWDSVATATGYRLYYAPYPELGDVRQASFEDMQQDTAFSITLDNGEAFYVWVSAYNDEGESQISNIEHFILDNKVIAFLPDPDMGFDEGAEIQAGLEEAFQAITQANLEIAFVDPKDSQGLRDLFFGTADRVGYKDDPNVLAVITTTTEQALALDVNRT